MEKRMAPTNGLSVSDFDHALSLRIFHRGTDLRFAWFVEFFLRCAREQDSASSAPLKHRPKRMVDIDRPFTTTLAFNVILES